MGFSEKGVDTEGGHINADLILFMPGPDWIPKQAHGRSA